MIESMSVETVPFSDFPYRKLPLSEHGRVIPVAQEIKDKALELLVWKAGGTLSF